MKKKAFNKFLHFRDNVNGVDVNTSSSLKELGLNFNKDDIDIVKYICWLVSDRAAILVSICKLLHWNFLGICERI